ncbi:MAG: hypothetical protein R2741_01270 [Methanolobus sp.]
MAGTIPCVAFISIINTIEAIVTDIRRSLTSVVLGTCSLNFCGIFTIASRKIIVESVSPARMSGQGPVPAGI